MRVRPLLPHTGACVMGTALQSQAAAQREGAQGCCFGPVLGTCPLAGTSLFKQPQPRVLTRLPNFCGRQQSDKHGSPGAAAVPWAASKAAKQSASMAVPGAAGRRQGGGLAISSPCGEVWAA